MKVMMVAPYFYPRTGGMENYAYNISKLLVKKYGTDVSVICSNWGREGYKEETIEDIRVYRLPYLFKVSSTPVSPFWRSRVSSIILKERPDIVNGHFPVPYIADVACRATHNEKIPFLLTYQNDLVGRNPLMRLLSYCYYYWSGFKTLRLSQKIIVTSEHYAQNSPYLRKFGDKIEVIPPGVAVEKFNPPAYTIKEGKGVLFVGQLNKASQHKGLSYLIEAMRIVGDSIKDAKLVVVGGGDYSRYYRKLVKTCGVNSRVEFAGFVRDEELPSYYRESSVVVLPSYNRAEGFGIVLIEAQACGRPVIGTTVGGIPSALRDGRTGLLVPPKDSARLADTIIRILRDNSLARRLGQAGYKWVRENLSWQKSAEKTHRVYTEVLGAKIGDGLEI
jgi:glycosyltransferase involved in cell wall biosynthesis